MLNIGKLPPEILVKILSKAPVQDPRVLIGPRVGFDCAVIDVGENYLVLKTDPITFATDEIGWYAVTVNVNDIATTGAVPKWFLTTILLPEKASSVALVEKITQQIYDAAEKLGISVIGGHTEITHGLERPIVVGTLIGEIAKEALITPKGAQSGDHILLTKGIPIEATAILAREFSEQLADVISPRDIQQARDYLYQPGISVFQDAQIAIHAGNVTAMHDPTEGGLSGALWELAEASGKTLYVDFSSAFIPPLADKICKVFSMNPFASIASGALLLTVDKTDVDSVINALMQAGIQCRVIGSVENGTPQVLYRTSDQWLPLSRPVRDEIARVFDELG